MEEKATLQSCITSSTKACSSELAFFSLNPNVGTDDMLARSKSVCDLFASVWAGLRALVMDM